MNALVVYDSAFGNTEKIAVCIASELANVVPTTMKLVSKVTQRDIQHSDILVVGSPTQGGLPTKPIQDFLSHVNRRQLSHTEVAAFDTRFALKEHGLGLRLLMRTIGFAASKIASRLRQKGGILVVAPEGFIVRDKEGPLEDGELDHAAKWARTLITSALAHI